jgi:uncharacterized RDD family membrane protein YckC
MKYANPGLRALEGIIDIAVTFVIFWIDAIFFGETTADSFSVSGAPAFAGFGLALLYFIIMEATLGATIGKLVLNLRVVMAADGSPIDWQAAIVRNVLRFVDGFAFYLVGFILVCAGATRQRLGDRVAGTVVVRR